MICEKCWADAYYRKLSNPRKSQTEHYKDLLIERDSNPCSPKEQAGEGEGGEDETKKETSCD